MNNKVKIYTDGACPGNHLKENKGGYGAVIMKQGEEPLKISGGYRNTTNNRMELKADGGVLFLDEIGDMPLALQTRLLRVLQEKKVTPLGGNTVYPVEFALVCATHQDLVQRVQQGVFREDLFYRIQEFHLRIPPLRQWPHIDR